MVSTCRPKTSSLIYLSLCGFLALNVGQFAKAQNAEPAIQAFSVNNVSPAEVEKELERILAGTNEKFSLVSDAKNHRILVSGSANVQDLARRVVDSLDRAIPAKAGGEAVLKTYPIKGDLNEIATKWQAQYPKESGVRFAVDTRLSQILVLAPAAVHEQLSQTAAGNEIKTSAPLPRNDDQKNPTATELAQVKRTAPRKLAEVEGEAVTKTIRLIRLHEKQFEDGLSTLWGKPIPKAVTDSGNASTYVFDAGDGRKLTIQIDRTTNDVSLVGPASIVEAWSKIVDAMDSPAPTKDQSTKLVSVQNADPAAVRKAMDAIVESGKLSADSKGTIVRMNAPKQPTADAQRERAENALKASLMSKLFQAKNGGDKVVQVGPGDQVPPRDVNQPGPQPMPMPNETPAIDADGALIGPVRIEYLDGLDIIIIQGHPKDVEKVKELIRRIEDTFKETSPEIEIYPLKNVAGEALAVLVRQLNEQLSTRQGNVSITPLGKPNALMLIGRKEAVAATIALIQKLDQPVAPETQFQVFHLKFTGCTAAQATIQEFFTNRPGLGTKATITADVRTNSLVVTASARDLEEIALVLKGIDVEKSEHENVLRVFPLKNTLANDVGPILQNAINGQAGAGQRAGAQNQQQQPQQQQGGFPGVQGQVPAQTGGANQQQSNTSTMLRFEIIDSKGRKEYKSGILTDVRITADPRSNSLMISAPEGSMELLAALVNQLDQMPSSEAQIKVFTIVNADAQGLAQLLQSLFGQSAGAGNRQGAGGFQNLQNNNAPVVTAGGDESTLIPMRFSVDQRTNSVVVSGSSGDLSVVEAILLRLDASDIQQRKNAVYRLKNAPATDVANAINQFLNNQRQLLNTPTGPSSPFEQIEREVIVVAEPVNNSLIISATPRYFDEIKKLIEQLDERPAMVMIQVMIGEVTLSNTDEFGIEIGLQDSILFDRSLLGNLVTTTQTTTFGNPATTVQSQNVLAATNTPGFDFAGQNLGNSGSTNALAKAAQTAGQGYSSFGVGRTNNELGFGGLVLSASSNSVSALLRALKECRRMDVLSRPQIMTLDNQPAFIQIGERVPRITGVNISATGQTNNVTLENVGLILGVTPRISPDGLVVMEIDAEKSQLGPEAEGIPVSITTAGQVIRSPRIATTTAQTTVSAISGQTVVLGGLISKSRSEIHRRVPLISDIPLIGELFRYDNITGARKELLIIMTPHVVRTEKDNEKLKHVEAARMNWCLADVIKVHGDAGLRGRADEWTDAETEVVYPDVTPSATETVPAPDKTPGRLYMPNLPSAPSAPKAPSVPKPVAPPNVKASSIIVPNENSPTPASGMPVLAPQNSNANNANNVNLDGRQPTPAYNNYAQPALMPVSTSARNGNVENTSNGQNESARRQAIPVRTAQPTVDANAVEPAHYEWPVAR